jgi:hypothetical protein
MRGIVEVNSNDIYDIEDTIVMLVPQPIEPKYSIKDHVS